MMMMGLNKFYCLPIIIFLITCHHYPMTTASALPKQETTTWTGGFDDLSGHKIGSILSYLTSEVQKIAKEVHEFTLKTRDSLQQLRRERVDLADLISANAEKIAQLEGRLKGNSVSAPSITQKEPVPTQGDVLGTSSRPQVNLPPMAALYNIFDTAAPSYTFNHAKQTSPSCFTYDDRNVNAINTFGSCVLMYSGEECMGHRVKIQSSHRMRVPAEMEHNNLSVGPCYALADLYDQLRLEGSPVQIYDSRRHGTCTVVDVEVQSLNTYDTCLKVYSAKDCKGESHMIQPGSSNHRDIQKNFKPAIKSIGPCYSQ